MKFKKGDLVKWRGTIYQIERCYSLEARIENVEWRGAFHMVSFGQLELVGAHR